MKQNYTVCEGLSVRQSAIHGMGLFAEKKIKAGDVLGFASTVVSEEESDHTIWVEDREYHEMVCGFRFINHADTPNVIIYDDLSIVALKDIQPDEELTHNYDGSGETDRDTPYFD